MCVSSFRLKKLGIRSIGITFYFVKILYSVSDARIGKQWEKQREMSQDMTKPTKWLCAQRRLRSAWASAQSDQSLRCTLNGQLSFLHADSEDSDQTGRMARLIWVFAGRICHFVGFVMRQLKYWLYDQYYNTSDRYGVHINKTLRVRTCFVLRRDQSRHDSVLI